MNKPLLVAKREKPPRPVESFGPEILAALLKGATEPLVLTMSYKMGVRFRLRIHQLRESMRRNGHDKYNLCARVRVTIEWPKGIPTEKQGRHIIPLDRDQLCKVTLKPNDTEFADFLSAAGVDPLSGVSHEDLPEGERPISDLDDMLRDL